MSEEIAFTREDADLLATLKTKVDTLTSALGAATRSMSALTAELAAMRLARAQEKGFMHGARWAFGTICAVLGAGILTLMEWLIKKVGG